jgi:magnesium chelatase family protein
VLKYNERLSGPLLDRIDMYIQAPSLEYDELRERPRAEASAAIKARVNMARAIQRARFKSSGISSNAHIGTKLLDRYCTLSPECEVLMRDAYTHLSMTARSYDRILRVARTIADLNQSEAITLLHLAEAIQYRQTSFMK